MNKIFIVASRTSDKLCLIYTRKGKKIGTHCNEEQVDRIITFASEVQATMVTVVDIYSYNSPTFNGYPCCDCSTGQKISSPALRDSPNGCALASDSNSPDKTQSARLRNAQSTQTPTNAPTREASPCSSYRCRAAAARRYTSHAHTKTREFL